MKFVGTTETFDPCFVPDWDKRLLEANLIITKELTDEMIGKVVTNKDKIILHHTITGLGGTEIEPNVKSYAHEFSQFQKLINSGFPINQYVLRVDPIIPFSGELLSKAYDVMTLYNTFCSDIFSESPTSFLRCRVSFVNLYPHVKDRFKSMNIDTIWNTYNVPKLLRENIVNQIIDLFAWPSNGKLNIETCAENIDILDRSNNLYTGCASYLDLETLGVEVVGYDHPDKPQRSTCNCLAKKQILGVKPGRCSHECVYCYWKD